MYSRRPEAVETGAEDGGAEARDRPKLAILCSGFYHLEELFRIGLLPAPESLHVRETIQLIKYRRDQSKREGNSESTISP